jgi:hypothetical protein
MAHDVYYLHPHRSGYPVGEGSPHNNPDGSRDALDHTMALASAITLACKNTMTLARAEDYRSCVKTWLQDLQRLYPHISGRTNNHMALHIYEFFLLFGPVRSWWCFPFERINGQLQRQPSNHKFGKSLIAHILMVFLIFIKVNLNRHYFIRSSEVLGYDDGSEEQTALP